MSGTTYVPSTNPGKTWGLCIFRGRNGLIASATEGTYTPPGNGSSFSSFQFIMFEAPRVELPLTAKRLTDKAQREGIAALTAKLVTEGRAVAP